MLDSPSQPEPHDPVTSALTAPADFGTFKPFSPTHAVAVGICLAVIILAIAAGRRMKRVHPAGAPRTGGMFVDDAGRMLGVLGLGVWTAIQFYWVYRAVVEGPGRLSQSLPLHVCDLAGLIGAIALITGSRFWTTILYFWGIALSTQAYATPVVQAGPLFTEFWLFWESHTLIIGSAVYVIAVREYRPTFRDAVIAFAFTALYAAAILPLNLWQDWNYGYVGPESPGAPTVIDRLGPWPLRLVPMTLIVAALFALVWAPWAFIARRDARAR